jgi:hypothetical protein
MKKIVITFALFFVFGFFGCGNDTTDKLNPAAGDYTVSDNLLQIQGSTENVIVTAKTGKSTGAITVYYRGIQGTDYTKTTTNPEAAGNYLVTFDVAEADAWNAATDLIAGNLNISTGKSGAELFEIPVTDITGLISQLMPFITHDDWFVGSDEDPKLITNLNSLVRIFGLGMDDEFRINPDEELTYEELSAVTDVILYHDMEAEVEYKGTDLIDADTVFYSNIPFSLIKVTVMGPERVSFTIGELLAEIGFTDSIIYPLTLDEFLNEVSSGTSFATFNKQGLKFYSAQTGGAELDGSTGITGVDMTIWSNWPLEDVASLF